MFGAMLSEQEQEQYRSLQEHVASNNLLAILSTQNEITSLLLKQQPKSVTVFDGDLLQFRSFMASFKHNIEMKKDNGQNTVNCFTLNNIQRDLVRKLSAHGWRTGLPQSQALVA